MRLRPWCGCACLFPSFLTSVVAADDDGGPAATRAPVPAQVARHHRFRVGAIEVIALSDGRVELPLQALLTGIDATQVQAMLAGKGLAEPVATSINAFLVKVDGALLLIDAGAGRLFGDRGGGLLTRSLAAAGHLPDEIDAVLLTHVHADHSGGLTLDGRPVFPNASVHVARAEVDFWHDDAAERAAMPHHKHAFAQGRAALAPYLAAGKVHPFVAPAMLMNSVRAIPAPGHTPGHTLFAIGSDGETMVFWGDTVHSADVQFARPEATIRFDIDEAQAAKQREAIFQQAAEQGWLIGAAHVPFPGVGRIARRGSGYEWQTLD